MSLRTQRLGTVLPCGKHLLRDGRRDAIERADSRVNPAVLRQLNGFLRAVLLLLKLASARKLVILSNRLRHDARLAEHQRSECRRVRKYLATPLLPKAGLQISAQVN